MSRKRDADSKIKAGVKLTGPYIEAEVSTKSLRGIWNGIWNAIKTVCGFGSARPKKILATILNNLHNSENADLCVPENCIEYLKSITENNLDMIEHKILLLFTSDVQELKERMNLFRAKHNGRAREVFVDGIVANQQYQEIILLRSLKQFYSSKDDVTDCFESIMNFASKDETGKIKLVENVMALYEKIDSNRPDTESRTITLFMMTAGNSSRSEAGINTNYIKRSCGNTKFNLYMIRPNADNKSLLALIEQYECHELLHVERTSELRKTKAIRKLDGRTVTDRPLDQIRKILQILINLIDYLHITQEGNITVHLIDEPLFPNLGFQCVRDDIYHEESYALIYGYYSPVDVKLTRFTVEVDGRSNNEKRNFIDKMAKDIEAFCADAEKMFLTKETFKQIEFQALKSLKCYLAKINRQNSLKTVNANALARVIDINPAYFSHLNKLFTHKGEIKNIDFSLLDYYDSPYVEQGLGD